MTFMVQELYHDEYGTLVNNVAVCESYGRALEIALESVDKIKKMKYRTDRFCVDDKTAIFTLSGYGDGIKNWVAEVSVKEIVLEKFYDVY